MIANGRTFPYSQQVCFSWDNNTSVTIHSFTNNLFFMLTVPVSSMEWGKRFKKIDK